jgi:pimeloyl-ACP methyl ester carboxylesterase
MIGMRRHISTRLLSGIVAATCFISVANNTTPALAASKKTAKTAKTAKTGTTKAKAPKLASITWTRCDGPVECTDFQMPLDGANPALGTTRVAVGRLLARDPKKRRGALFVNPGGPGGSAIDLVRSIADDRNSGRLGEGFDDWDVIGVDPRGVGRSEQIKCGSRLSELGINPFAAGAADADRGTVRHTWIESCQAQSGALLFHAGTVDMADDIDRVRIALGEEQIDYFGYSYGTVIGAVYAAQHGIHVRSMVLDAAVDPSLYGSSSFIISAAAGMERRIADFATSCSNATRCPMRVPGRETAEQIARAIGDTLTLIDTKTSAAGGLRIRSSVYGYLEESSNWAGAANYLSALEKAVAADAGGPIEQRSTIFDLLTGNAAYWAVNCTDGAFPTTSAEHVAASNAVKANSPIVGSSMLYLADLCVDWPAPRPLGSLVSTVARPIVVVGGLRDTRTPIEWSRALRSTLGNATLIVRDGDGHASYPRSACIRQTVTAYFTANVVPADELLCA